MEPINGKTYPLWGQFVDRQNEWIGGILEDLEYADEIEAKTKITGITLTPNGDDSAYFTCCGEGFSCGFDVQYGGIIGGDDGWITFSGYAGSTWRIKRKEDV